MAQNSQVLSGALEFVAVAKAGRSVGSSIAIALGHLDCIFSDTFVVD